MSGENSDIGHPVFGRTLRGLLRPMVRAMIAKGVTAPALYRLLKRLFVEVAEQDFPLKDGRQTDSRISVLTGVHRKDVRAFRDAADADNSPIQEKVALIASVMGRWLADPDMTREDGTPRALPRSGEEQPNFERLVQSISKDIRPRTVLDELIRQKLVDVGEDGLVHLRADAFLGPADTDQSVHFFAENVGDHIAAAVDNLLAEDPPFMERAVFYNRLTETSVDAIEADAHKLGTDALVALNRSAHARQQEDLDKPDGTHRFRFGVFFYREDESGGTAQKNRNETGGDDDQT